MSKYEAIKEKLLNRKKELELGMSLLYKEKVTDDQVQDTGDQALSSSLEDIKISLHDTKLNEYQMVIKALDMIEQGTYGLCVDCERPIAEKRLFLFPNSTRCLACQEAIEEK